MKVALDVDGTLADTMLVWIDIYNQKREGKLTKDDVSHWNFWKAIGLDLSGFYEILSDCWSADRWTGMPLIEKNVAESIEKLRSIAQVDIVTARNPLNHEFVKKWLEAKKIPYDSYVGVKSGADKAWLDYDYFIDDSPENALEIAGAGKKVLLYDQPWNRHLDNHAKIKRIKKISDAVAAIKSDWK